MLTHTHLYARDVIRMHEVVPVEYHVLVVRVVPKHGLPAARQIDALGITVEIPDTVVRGHGNQRITLLQFIQNFPVPDAFKAYGQRRTKQLHQEMQVCVPAIDRTFIGNTQEARDLVVNRETDNKRGPDMQFVQTLEVVLCRFGSAQRICNFNNAQMAESTTQPLPVLELFVRQAARIALRKTTARRHHGLDRAAILGD